MGKRIDYWKQKGYTEQEIQSHLDYEKRKRDSEKYWIQKYTEDNRDKIEFVKQALKDSVYSFRNVTIDGKGFWISKPYESQYTRRKSQSIFISWDGYNHLEFYLCE